MSIPQQLVKAEATGNDFVMFADPEGKYDPTVQDVTRICDRHFGIGADGVIRVTAPENISDLSDDDKKEMQRQHVQWFMDYRNGDGTFAEMCGNGTRATALFIEKFGLADVHQGDTIPLGTRSGVKLIDIMEDDPQIGANLFRVNMGKYQIGKLNEYTVTVPDNTGEARGTYVDMGNPHVVAVLEDAYSSLPVVDDLDLAEAPEVSPSLENGQNVEFVRVDEISAVDDLGEATMRVYERGCGETLSCGTGLCATAVVLRARTGINHWNIAIRGGVVRLDVTDDTVMIEGPAALVAKLEMITD